MEKTRELFEENWNKWEPAVIEYASASKSQPAALKYALRDIDGDSGKTLHDQLISIVYEYQLVQPIIDKA